MISKVKPLVHDKYEKIDWYQKWFDSPYYHILYKNRDEKEAEVFLDSLIRLINPEKGAKILDAACGKGRHSIYLNKMGFDVSGFDLSEQNIDHDKKFENDSLNFYLHDMREVFRTNYFDIVLNLFSSFGYFEKERDNLRCIQTNALALKKGGTFVFDYFNAAFIRGCGNSSMEYIIDGIKFQISKEINDDFIIKKIFFNDNGKDYHFEERLGLFGVKELEKYFNESGLSISHRFGNYQLDEFDEKKSDRLILLATKK